MKKGKVAKDSVSIAREWFCLKKYEPLREFTQLQWGQQIARRHMLLCAAGKDNGCLPDKQVLEMMLPSIMENPCSDWDYSISRTPFRELTRNDISRLVDLAAIEPGEGGSSVDGMVGDIVGGQGWFGHLLIDLGASKKDLIESFRQWLENRQDSLNNFPLRSDPCKQLLNAKVLLYCDLIAWSACSGIALTENDFIDLLGLENGSKDSNDLRAAYRRTERNKRQYINLTLAHHLLLSSAS